MSIVKAKTNNIEKPKQNNSDKNNLTLTDLLPNIDNRILPSEDWCIDYFPKNEEPTDDILYNKIGAELELLCQKQLTAIKNSKPDNSESTADELPGISKELTTLESSDIEAMLFGMDDKINESTPLEVDDTDVNLLLEDLLQCNSNLTMENNYSSSILDEVLQKGIEEHLLSQNSPLKDEITINNNVMNDISKLDKQNESAGLNKIVDTVISEETIKPLNSQSVCPASKIYEVTYVVFKIVINGVCQKSVTCLKNLTYSIKIEEKSVELLAAPENIFSLDDLRILLEIVHETDLTSSYISY